MKNVTDLINKFEKFVETEISSAVKELENIQAEKNRKHLQRLVYTNLINRFDVLIDNLLLIFATRENVEDIARLNYLRERHSRKLRTLLRYCFMCEDRDLDRPRVNVGDGRIHDVYNRKHPSIPRSIIGYADYLYSKRNVLIHGDGSSLEILHTDKVYMKKYFNVTPVKYIGIKMSSINTASTFYKYLCRYMIAGKWPEKRGW